MKHLVLGIIFFGFASGCASTDSCLKDVSVENFSITINKDMCFGTCPVYTATVYGDGNVSYEGRMYCDRMGSWMGAISKDDLCSLLTEIRNQKLIALDTTFIDNVPDAPVTTITITDMGRTKTFRWNMGSPAQLRELNVLMIKATHDHPRLRKIGQQPR